MRIFVGSIFVVIGALMVIKSEWLLENFGSISWAEEHLGAEGGSRLMYKLIGIAIILIGFMLITNLLGGIILSIFSPLFGGFKQ